MRQSKALLGLFLFFSIACLGLAGIMAGIRYLMGPDGPPPYVSNESRAEYEDLKLNCVRLHNTSEAFMSPKDKDDWAFCKKVMVFR